MACPGGGFGSVDNNAIGSLVAFDGDLYAVVGNGETGPEVWRSSSGAIGSWGRVADTAFGYGDGHPGEAGSVLGPQDR